MCGLTGFCDFNKGVSQFDLQKATDCLQHRGPDNGNQQIFNLPNVTIGLGHRRLSIIDLSEKGNQPMYNDDKSVAIILNGEIYNFLEIKKILEEQGHIFYSNSDTEVIIKAYQQWGIDAVQKFIGMFAFALVDLKINQLYIVRDRAGVKPLYYYYKDDCILFASELKALHQYKNFKKEIDHEAVNLYFKYGYIPAPHSIFLNTYKLTSGNYLQIDVLTKQLSKHEYWNVLDYYNKPKLKISEEEAEEQTEKLFTSAFQYRMVSDVPVGVFLSGGYDSSLVTALLQKNNSQKIKTFTIGFNEAKYNEAPHAKKIAEYLETDHHEYYCTTKEAQDILPFLAHIYDEPFGDSSSIPTTLVSRFARKHVTVALSADGGDELFAGYNRYTQLSKLKNTIFKSPSFINKPLGKLAQNFPYQSISFLKNKAHKFSKLGEVLQGASVKEIADSISQIFTNTQLSSLLNSNGDKISLSDECGDINSENDFINYLLAIDYKTYLVDDILVKVDRATMSVGLEGREPLLDHRIIEFVSQLPSNFKYKNGDKKYLLKKIVHKYIPQHLLERPKTGFGMPVKEWLRTDLKNFLMEMICPVQLAKHGLVNVKYAIKVRDNFLAGQDGDEAKVWLILMFQMWWNRWMEMKT